MNLPRWFIGKAFPSLGVNSEADIPQYIGLPAVVPKARSQLWWTRRHVRKSMDPLAEETQLIMIGDSLVHHFEVKGRPLWDLYFGRYKPINLGFSADTTENAIWRLQNGELAGMDPRLAVIMIGTNNAGLRRDPAAHTREGIRRIIEIIHERLPNTQVLLLGIFPRGPTARNRLRQINQQVNELLPTLADGERVHYLDIGHVFLDEKNLLHRSVMYDFLHPTVAGYQIWAEAIGPKVIELMNMEQSGGSR